MTQPPSQPPQGGFGPPQDPPPGGGFGPPQTPPPPQGAPADAAAPAGPAVRRSAARVRLPAAARTVRAAWALRPAAAARSLRTAPAAGAVRPTRVRLSAAARVPRRARHPPGGGSCNPFKGKPLLIAAAAVAVALIVGGTVWAVSGDDDKKEPVAQQTEDPKPGASGDAPVNPGDGSGDGGEETEDLNEGRQAGESKVLWYKEAPDAPGSGADAPGQWITDKTAVKAAYKDLYGYNVSDGKPSWDTISFPHKICAVTPEKTADNKIVVASMSGSSDSAKCNQLQLVDLVTGEKGWTQEVADGELFDSVLSIEMALAGNTLMVGRSQSGTAYDVRTGKKLWDSSGTATPLLPRRVRGRRAADPGRLLRRRRHQRARRGPRARPEHRQGQVDLPVRQGLAGRAHLLRRPAGRLRHQGGGRQRQEVVEHRRLHRRRPQLRSQVAVDENFDPGCGWAILARDLQGCEGVVVEGDTLYLPTAATTGANELVAISLANGKELWRESSPWRSRWSR